MGCSRKSRTKAKLKEVLAKKREDYENTLRLVQDAYAKKRTQELSQNGLVILRAFYGNPDYFPSSESDSIENDEVIDVTVGTQLLVQNSQLLLPYDVLKVPLPLLLLPPFFLLNPSYFSFPFFVS